MRQEDHTRNFQIILPVMLPQAMLRENCNKFGTGWSQQKNGQPVLKLVPFLP